MLEADLRAALGRDELVLFYQPQLTADGTRIVAVEGLARWRHPTQGLVPPNMFIPLAERIGLISAIGDWALRQACRDLARWPTLDVSVNVSPKQFENADFADHALAIVRSENADPRRIELEITENVLIDQPERGRAILAAARAHGFRIALDDFGTGYSSLSYLRHLALDRIKIDRSFVSEVNIPQGAAIVHAVAALGRALGLKVTAEGVETREQQIFLKAAGCHTLQGFYFSRPVPAEEIDALMAAQTKRLTPPRCA